MKRFLCTNHIHHLRAEGKAITLSSTNCTICRYNARIRSLVDIANDLHTIADSMHMCGSDHSYDPLGFTWIGPLEHALNALYKGFNTEYKQEFITAIKGE